MDELRQAGGIALDIESLLMRADEELLQDIVGRSTVRLLNCLDPGSASPSRMRALIEESIEPSSFLESPTLASMVDLLRPEEARDLALHVGVPQARAYDELRALKFRRGGQVHRQLADWLKIDLPAPRRPETAVEAQRVTPSFSLFPHQRAGMIEVLRYLESDDRRVLLHMPTGSGKTRTAMHVVAEILRRHEPAVVVWLAYSEELCTQAAEEFVQAWSHLGDRDVQLHRYWGGHVTDLDDVTDGIVIAGLTRTVRGAQRDIQPLLRLAGRTCLVVLDEAHQAVAETYSLVLDLLVNYRAGNGLLGLSATPGRTWNDPAQDRELADFFCSQKVTLEVQGYASPVDYLVAEGYLARPSYRSLTYSGGLQLTAQDLTDLQRSTDISDRILHLLADDEQRNLVIIMEVEGLLRKHSRVILFATTVEHANILSAVFRSRGVAARAISSNTPIPVRQRYIGEFKLPDETPRLLCNYGVLTTGFDAPATSAALIARPTKSLVLYSQMVGRAIRGVRAGGNPDAEIVTVVDTSLPGFGDLSQAFENWEDVW